MKLFITPITAYDKKNPRDKKVAQNQAGLRLMSRAFLGLTDEEKEIAHDFFRKPYLKNRRDIHFNLSHAEGFALLGVHNRPIGVDIEKIRPVSTGIAFRFLTEEDREFLSKTEEDEKIWLSAFFRLWTAKESYGKAIGKGLRLPLSMTKIDWRANRICDRDEEYGTFSFTHYLDLDGYVICICAKEGLPPGTITFVEEK